MELKIDTSVEHLDMLSDILSDFGAAAITYIDAKNQPIYEPPPGETPYWKNTTLVGLFAAHVDADEIIKHIRDLHGDKIITSWVSEPLEEQVWESACMDHFEPTLFGENLWICPSWKEVPDPDAVNILLDPGLAFGTGTHPTTALCLELLTQINVKGKKIIDFGCGSGILAIAAIKLGAAHAHCIDNDPQALIATEENAKKNNVLEKIAISPPDVIDTLISNTPEEIQADLLIANILAKPLIELQPLFVRLLKDDGVIMLSGILSSQQQEITDTYKDMFDISTIGNSDDWLCILAAKKTVSSA